MSTMAATGCAKRISMRRWVRSLVSRSIMPVGAVRPMLRGPGRGLRYHVFPDYGISPLFGGWEPEAQKIMARHVRPGAVAYDLGGNYGIHTLIMARLVGSSGHVYAFEPVPGIMAQLRENVTLNGFDNVTCVEAAAGRAAGMSHFLLGRSGAVGRLTEAAETDSGLITVDVVSLDQFVLNDGNRPPDFIKIDVEGAESKVLAGTERVLEACRPVLLVDLHSPEEDQAVGRVLAKHRYTAYRATDGTRVRDLTSGWPSPDGLWGQIVAFAQTPYGNRLFH